MNRKTHIALMKRKGTVVVRKPPKNAEYALPEPIRYVGSKLILELKE